MTRRCELFTVGGKLCCNALPGLVPPNGYHHGVMLEGAQFGNRPKDGYTNQLLALEGWVVVKIAHDSDRGAGISHAQEDIRHHLPVATGANNGYSHVSANHQSSTRVQERDLGTRAL